MPAIPETTTKAPPKTLLEAFLDRRRSGAGWLRGLSKATGLCFHCPSCKRDIRFRKGDAGADIICPHCTAKIVAPDPATNHPARISDPALLAVKQFQRNHAHSLVDLKRGRLVESVIRKQQRVDASPPPGDYFPLSPRLPAPGGLPPPRGSHNTQMRGLMLPPHPTGPSLPQPPANQQPLHAPSSPPRAAPAPPPARLRKPAGGQVNFQARDEQPVHVKKQDIPLPWDLDPRDHPRGIPEKISPWMAASLATCGVLAVSIVVLLIWRDMRQSAHHQQDARLRQEERVEEALLEAQQRERESTSSAAALLVARQGLSSPDWRGLIPFVRHPRRVVPLMESYYARFPWRPMQIEEGSRGQFHKLLGREFLAFEAADALSGQNLAIGMENTPEGWKLDWEVLVPLAGVQWNDFHRDRPVAPRKIRVAVIRRTPTAEMLAVSGIREESAFGLMLWCNDITDRALYAVLDEESEQARELARYASFDSARKFILELSFLPASPGGPKDLVEIHNLVTLGWSVMEDHPEPLSGGPAAATPAEPVVMTATVLEE